MRVVDYSLSPYQDIPEHLEKGYQPWGSPLILKDELVGGGFKENVYQAMVRYEDEATTRDPSDFGEDGYPKPPRQKPNETRTIRTA